MDLAGMFPQQGGEVAGRLRPAEKISLDLVTFVVAQKAQLLGGLDPFRHDAESQAVRHGDDGPRDRRVVAVGREVAVPPTVSRYGYGLL